MHSQLTAGLLAPQAERAAGNWTTGFTNFHSPPVCNEALSAISQMADVAAVRFGGYEMAERCRLAVGREEMLAAAADDPGSLGCVAALAVQGKLTSLSTLQQWRANAS